MYFRSTYPKMFGFLVSISNVFIIWLVSLMVWSEEFFLGTKDNPGQDSYKYLPVDDLELVIFSSYFSPLANLVCYRSNVLVWISSRSADQARVQVTGVYLGNWNKERKRASKGYNMKQVTTVSNRSLIFLERLEKPGQNTNLRVISPKAERLWIFTHNSH